MSRKPITTYTVLFFLCCLQAWAADEGKLYVNTQPPGAKFSYRLKGGNAWIIGGSTPKTLTLQPGKYEVKFQRENFLDESRPVEIKKGETSGLDLRLKNKFGKPAEFLIDRDFVPSEWPLAEARRSFAERERFTLANAEKREFFVGANALLNGALEPAPKLIMKEQLGFIGRIELAGTAAIPGDVVIVMENGNRFAMVYAGEFFFPTKQNPLCSYFYYPYKFESGMQLNTYPPRWDRQTLYAGGLLKPAAKTASKEFSKGLSHERAEFAPFTVDRFQLEYLNSPKIGGSLFQTVGGFSFEVWRLDPKFADPLDDMSTIQSPGTSGWLGGIVGKYRFKGTREHHGWDLFARQGTSVKAVADGTLREYHQKDAEGKSKGYGKYLILNPTSHPDYAFVFAHLQDVTVKTTCKKGDVIGTVGATGWAEPNRPHLHFEIRRGAGGKPILPPKSGVIDPAEYYPFPKFYVEELNSNPKPIQLPEFSK